MSRGGNRPPPSAEEYEALLARYEEATELLRAIRHGEVDALLIEGAEGSRVYTVKSADEPYRILVEQMQEGAVTLTGDGAILYCNPRFAELVQAPSNQLIGSDVFPLVAAHDRASLVSLLLESARGPGRLEVSLQAADGSLVPVYLSCNAMSIAGERTLCLLVADLTEQRRMAEVLRQSQKIEAVGQLTAGVAHDFNNLLTATLGNLEIAERLSKDAAVTRFIQGASRAAERGARLTGQLLAFSRKQHLLPKAMDVNQTVTGMGELLQSTMGGIINIERVLKPDLWPALVDPNQIELVILNLAINARDAMPLGGTLTIETSNVHLSAPENPGDLA
ncbi:MAG: PAS domain S-box protein, partial [Alphaproteobacteria bacterium]|nr:PAS domain S-box protein [Alphaproteobacteria bacterium]